MVHLTNDYRNCSVRCSRIGGDTGCCIPCITGRKSSSKNSGGIQYASVDGLVSISDNISQAYSGRGALPC